MRQATVVIIGGGATGVGILRDLSMRGINALLLEQRDLAHGTSSRFHGLLHSGARYAVKDSESAKECIEENYILKKIAKHCVEETEGLFVRLPEDDELFEEKWLKSCAQVQIPAVQISPKEALKLEPNLSNRIVSAYKVPDSAIDGFRLVWQNVSSARKYGGDILTYTEVIGIDRSNKKVTGVKTRDTLTGRTGYIACEFVVNAAGSWVGEIAKMAGISVNVQPDKGLLIAFNHRFTSRVINRLRPPSDGDIFVPHGSITIYGTTSAPADKPDDTACQTEEVLKLLKMGKPLFEEIYNYRILRAFSGTRPLYSPDSNSSGRAASRNFVIIDHSQEGISGLATIVGGKFTTYRLMAEKMSDLVSSKLGVNKKCKTAAEPLITDPPSNIVREAKRFFPTYSLNRTVARLGENFEKVVKILKQDPAKRQIICECEMVTLAEIETMAADSSSHDLSDIRRKTRMGMGTCQGAFCAFRTACVAAKENFFADTNKDTVELIKNFTQARWRGIRPALWRNQMREAELMRGIYSALLNIDGEVSNEGNESN